MKLRAEITIELDADDYVAAAEHQRRVEALFQAVKSEYGQASFGFRQLRERNHRPAAAKLAPAPAARARVRHHTGNLANYEDYAS